MSIKHAQAEMPCLNMQNHVQMAFERAVSQNNPSRDRLSSRHLEEQECGEHMQIPWMQMWI